MPGARPGVKEVDVIKGGNAESIDSTNTPDDGRNIDLARTVGSGPLWRQYLRALGPGLITGASDDDPSGIATYAQAGASFGLSMLWTALITLPLMTAVQEICDRTALATGRGLGELVVRRFGRGCARVIGILMVALIVANGLNIAADLVAVGAGMHLLHAGPTSLWAALTGLSITVLLIGGSFAAIAQAFKVLCIALLGYVGVLAMVHVSWPMVVLRAFVPSLTWSKNYVALLIAVLGTTISPYLFFWQSLHRLEEMREEPAGGARPLPLTRRSRRAAAHKLFTSRVDVATGMAFSTAVMFAIIVASAATLGQGGHSVTITSAAQAAEALRPIAGHAAEVIFALGFIGSGTLAIPVLAGAGSAGMAGLLGKRSGFSNSPQRAPVFYGLVVAGTIGGTALSLLGLDPIRLLLISAVVNGLAAAPFLVVVMLIANDQRLMGQHRNRALSNLLGCIATGLMTAAAIALIVTSLS